MDLNEVILPGARQSLDLRLRNLFFMLTDLQNQVSDVRSDDVIVVQSVKGGVSLGAPTSAPSITLLAGAMTGAYQYAFSYYSTRDESETKLSSTATANPSSNRVRVTCDASTYAQHDLIKVYRRPDGGGDDEWRWVGEVANPGTGTEDYDDNTDDEFPLGKPTPNTYAFCLFTPYDDRFSIRRAFLSASRTYASSATAYWLYWLATRKTGVSTLNRITYEEDTIKAGFREEYPITIPRWHTAQEVPSNDLAYRLAAYERVYLVFRGIGAIDPLPNLTVQLDLLREGVR